MKRSLVSSVESSRRLLVVEIFLTTFIADMIIEPDTIHASTAAASNQCRPFNIQEPILSIDSPPYFPLRYLALSNTISGNLVTIKNTRMNPRERKIIYYYTFPLLAVNYIQIAGKFVG